MIHVIEYFILINDKMVSMYVCRRMYMYVCMYVRQAIEMHIFGRNTIKLNDLENSDIDVSEEI